MSIGKSSLARAAAMSAPRAVTESAPVQPTLAAREVAVDSIALIKGTKSATDEALVKSVRKHGVLEPLTLAQTEDGSLLLVAGARRLAAAREAGLATVPATVLTLTASAAASARREIARFVAATPTVASATPESPTAVGQAMPAWLL